MSRTLKLLYEPSLFQYLWSWQWVSIKYNISSFVHATIQIILVERPTGTWQSLFDFLAAYWTTWLSLCNVGIVVTGTVRGSKVLASSASVHSLRLIYEFTKHSLRTWLWFYRSHHTWAVCKWCSLKKLGQLVLVDMGTSSLKDISLVHSTDESPTSHGNIDSNIMASRHKTHTVAIFKCIRYWKINTC